MNIQFTLTVHEGKEMIARGVLSLPKVKRALASGKVLLKGGTTVSIISETIVKQKLKVSGRISPKGASSSKEAYNIPHTILIEKGNITNVDECLEDLVIKMGSEDIYILSPNAIDWEGNAAMMAGAYLGGGNGKVISGLMAEGVQIILPSGLEKLIPGKIADAVKAAGRKKPDVAFGMAVGLIPIMGKVFTEIDAIESIVGLKPQVIGKGGILGAEGATTFSLDGDEEHVKTCIALIKEVKGAQLSHKEWQLDECAPGSPGCGYHLGCLYRREKNI